MTSLAASHDTGPVRGGLEGWGFTVRLSLSTLHDEVEGATGAPSTPHLGDSAPLLTDKSTTFWRKQVQALALWESSKGFQCGGFGGGGFRSGLP